MTTIFRHNRAAVQAKKAALAAADKAYRQQFVDAAEADAAAAAKAASAATPATTEPRHQRQNQQQHGNRR